MASDNTENVPDVFGPSSVLTQPIEMAMLPAVKFLEGAACSYSLRDAVEVINSHTKSNWWDKKSLVMLCCDTAQFHYFVAVVAGPGRDMRRAYHYVNQHGSLFDDGECVETDMRTLQFHAVRAFVVPAINMPAFEMEARQFMQTFAESGTYVIFVRNCRTFAEAFLEDVVHVPRAIVLDVFEAAGALIGTAMSNFIGTATDFWRGFVKLFYADAGANTTIHPYGETVWESQQRIETKIGTRIKDLHRAAARARERYEWQRARAEWDSAPLVFNEGL